LANVSEDEGEGFEVVEMIQPKHSPSKKDAEEAKVEESKTPADEVIQPRQTD
jgi:hypothetical protein